MEQGETIPDFAPKKLARQLDFTVMCRASANAILPEQQPMQSQSQSKSQSQPQQQQQQQQQQRSPPLQLQLSQPQQAQSSQPIQSQQVMLHRVPHLVQKLQLSTLPVPKQDSPRPRVRSNIETKDGTPKKQKQCNCKNSRCLKLYCECFAAGIYCDGCNCINCHNNVDNEAARQEAVGATLERNPNAFRSKITNSPHGSRDAKEDAREVQMLAKHNKGCHCKKSGCLKKYCECFQANILCSENCKCMDCKNFEESEERRALFQGDDAVAHIQQAANAAISGAIGSSGYGTSLASRKRKSEEVLFGIAAKDHRVSRHQQENHVRASVASSVSSIPVSRTSNAAVLGSSKFTYRSPLADILQAQDVKELCSLLVVVSGEAAKTLAEKSGKMDRQTERDNIETSVASSIQERDDSQIGNDVQNGVPDDRLSGNQADGDRSSNSGSNEGDVQNKRPLSPGTRALMCDEEDTMFMAAGSPTGVAGHCQNTTQKLSNGHDCTEVYAEQEKLVLTRFRDFLNRLITCGSIKETMSSPLATGIQQEPVENDTVKAGNETWRHKEHHGNGIVKSPSPATAQMSQTVTAVTSPYNHNLPIKVGLPIQNGGISPEIKSCN